MWWKSLVADGTLVRETHAGAPVYCYRERPHTLDEVLRTAAREYGNNLALVTRHSHFSFGELADAVDKLALAIAATGVEPGDRVAVLLPNDARICLIQLAVASLRAITVCLNVRFQADEIATLVRRSNPRLAIVAASLSERLPAAALPTGARFILSEDPRAQPEELAALLHPLQSSVSRPDSSSQEDDPTVMMFTSGTTGTPKGAMLTHLNMIHSAITYSRYFSSGPETRTLIVMPLHYATGLIAQFLHMLLVGGQSIIWPIFKAKDVVKALRTHQVTYFIGVPTMYQLMLLEESFAAPALPHWRVAAYGGSPMPGDTVRTLQGRFPALQLFDAYGLTETSSPATILTPDQQEERRGSVGLPVPGAEVKVTDAKGDTPVGVPGELLVRGPMVIPGYWDDPESTRTAIAGGWLRTGDVAKLDQDGFVYILDRQKDMIIRGGYKIYSVQLEYLLLNHPEVQEAAVVGIPDPIFYEEILAVIVPSPGSKISPEDVREFVRNRAADYEVPKYVTLEETLPRNPTGKVLKRFLRERFVAGMQ